MQRTINTYEIGNEYSVFRYKTLARTGGFTGYTKKEASHPWHHHKERE